jgi:hypothetical protein
MRGGPGIRAKRENRCFRRLGCGFRSGAEPITRASRWREIHVVPIAQICI